eukprot:CAMPEP_0185591720 /NCGR_PEP_ID=MMETSP0434-20130131/65479_1 /TAXON_ID=626734 ORGANISM="Favella taraikaensis, Strain Fe Narragansett Bay" /NCGR_SAMPLE_ID=MMETSP0434 /ASSEMBLY_ACC=CAM_ASM_000379 /LENGTH=54 /DNA_ID=CAMNT_0028216947 /DNA_START=1558 /DNA_END=1722 /DNA_ORIENTATION=+
MAMVARFKNVSKQDLAPFEEGRRSRIRDEPTDLALMTDSESSVFEKSPHKDISR